MKTATGLAAISLIVTVISATPTRADDFSAALDEITGNSLREHYTVLASDAMDGRFAGTEAYQRAADYVAQQFALVGLEAAGEEGWFQEVPLVSFRIDTETATVFTHRDGVDTELTYREDVPGCTVDLPAQRARLLCIGPQQGVGGRASRRHRHDRPALTPRRETVSLGTLQAADGNARSIRSLSWRLL